MFSIKFSSPKIKIWLEPMFFYGFFCGFERCGSAAFPNFRGGTSSPPQAAKCVRTNSRIQRKINNSDYRDCLFCAPGRNFIPTPIPHISPPRGNRTPILALEERCSIFTRPPLRPQQESNPHQRLRRALHYLHPPTFAPPAGIEPTSTPSKSPA